MVKKIKKCYCLNIYCSILPPAPAPPSPPVRRRIMVRESEVFKAEELERRSKGRIDSRPPAPPCDNNEMRRRSLLSPPLPNPSPNNRIGRREFKSPAAPPAKREILDVKNVNICYSNTSTQNKLKKKN